MTDSDSPEGTSSDSLEGIRDVSRSESEATNAEDHHVEYVEGSDHAELLVRRDGLTVTVEGDPEEVRRHFERHYADAVDATPEAVAADVESYPMPDLGELESIPAAEFYGAADEE